MNERFSIEDLERKGFVLNADGTYSKSTSDYEKAIAKIKATIKPKSKLIVGNSEPPTKLISIHDCEPLHSALTINGIIPGLNGSNGLMRAHWSKKAIAKKKYCEIIRRQLADNKLKKHLGQVRVTYIGYKSILADWTNFVSSIKHIEDSLVKEKIIIGDNPNVIVEFIPKQIKCKRKEQKVVVIIEDI